MYALFCGKERPELLPMNSIDPWLIQSSYHPYVGLQSTKTPHQDLFLDSTSTEIITNLLNILPRPYIDATYVECFV